MFGGFSPGSLILILLVVVLLFGTSKLKGLGSDVGGVVKGFRKAMAEDDQDRHARIGSDRGGEERNVKSASDFPSSL